MQQLAWRRWSREAHQRRAYLLVMNNSVPIRSICLLTCEMQQEETDGLGEWSRSVCTNHALPRVLHQVFVISCGGSSRNCTISMNVIKSISHNCEDAKCRLMSQGM